jgi:predicted anti-sigma-YlaC factor YlaD
MSFTCDRGPEPALLSGYLDGELTQADEQRVRLHLEDCPTCRTTFEELARLREVTMETRFEEPTDEQWRETPRGGVSRSLRGAGWGLLIVWLVTAAAFAAWELLTGPERLFEKLLAFGAISGFLLLLLSALLDRIHDAKGDRYKEVDK